MKDNWDYERSGANCIDIKQGGRIVAQIINDDDFLTEENMEDAKFIVDACNRKAITSE